VVEASLDLLQKLVAHNLLTGSADALPPSPNGEAAAVEADDPEGGAAEPESKASTGTPGDSRASHTLHSRPTRPVSGCVVELMCRGYELGDEAVELALLKGLLTAISCASFRVHGEALLRCVRTCYNVFLGSRSEVNQSTAKATLTQALTIVFHRMEADSALVPPPAITVADLLYPGSAEGAASPVAQFVQGFVTRVLTDLPSWAPYAAGGAAGSEGGALLSERDGAFQSDGEEDGLSHGQQPPLPLSEAVEAEGEERLEPLHAAPPAAEEEALSSATLALRRDAFLVFRALCKLSMKTPPQGASTAADLFAARGKALSLELLKVLLANAGPVFRGSPKFAHAIKTYLCRSLLKNCNSGLPDAFQLSCSIFIRLLERFRPHLKAEIGIFTEVIFLKALDLPAPGATGAPYWQRVTVLRCLGHQCRDAQLMVDLFVNYDCDLNSTNLYERLVGVLLRLVREGAPGEVEKGSLTATQEAAMRVAGTRALTDLTAALAKWIDKENSAAAGARAAAAAAAEAAAAAAEAAAEGVLAEAVAVSRQGAPLSEAERFEQAKTSKALFKEGIELFNKKPKKGIQFLQKASQLSDAPDEVAHFLRTTPDLDKTQIGELLGSPDEADLRVMHAYIDSMDFPEMELDDALRAFLSGFRLPGEAQKIDRLMEKFAERFCRSNPGAFKNADTAYVLAYSVIMLNTDAHNPMVKQKMSRTDFLKNNRGIDDGSDVPEAYMGALYDRITRNEIKMKDASLGAATAGAASKGVADELTKVFLNLIPGRKASAAAVDPAEAIMEAVRDRERAATDFFEAEDVGNVRPMWSATWEPLLRIVSAAFDAAEDRVTVLQCLDFLRHGVHLGAALGLDGPRDAFVQALARHTLLSAPATMRAKHVEALRALVAAAENDANNLGPAWVHVLRAVSRYEHLHHLGAGFNDASLFNPELAAAEAAAAERARGAKGAFAALKLGRAQPPPKRKTMPAGAPGAPLPSPGGGEGEEELVPPPRWVLDALSPEELSSKVFLRTHALDSDAVVSFVRALCAVSLEELESRSPRVYSLAKIVESAHFNMDRIRLVWSRIWAVLADFFVTVGLLKNLSVAMYVVDSLRQLSMQFLSRDELANYSFQNDFLRPYVVIMRASQEVPTRELIIRCMSQMVAARVGNIKSGWKSMFMVFTTAANDQQRSIVVLAFETIERIMRQHFNHIVETDSTAFTDCVNCLVAFTNSRCSPDVSLNAIAFLRFCALKLAEGALGNLEAAQAGTEAGSVAQRSGAPGATFFTDADAHLYFWFPLLAGLSELTFDSRRDVRHSALEVLFDTLKFHGSSFSTRFWERVFDKILFPIFDHVRAEGLTSGQGGQAGTDSLDGAPADSPAGEVDAWLFETCTHCLHLIVDLYAQFFAQVAPLLPRLLSLLTSLSLRQHEQLSACGVAALSRVADASGPLFSAEQWQALLDAVELTMVASLPDLRRLVGSSEQGEAWLTAAAEARSLGATQLLLVRCAEALAMEHAAELSGAQLRQLLDLLQRAHRGAAEADADAALRAQLRAAAAAAAAAAGPDTAPALRLAAALPEPPLLSLEVTAGRAHLRALAAVSGGARGPCRLDAAAAEERLAEAVADVLSAGGAGGTMPPEEAAARAPLAEAALTALATGFSEDAFLRRIRLLFPACMDLVRADGVPTAVRAALADTLQARLLPLLDRVTGPS